MLESFYMALWNRYAHKFRTREEAKMSLTPDSKKTVELDGSEELGLVKLNGENLFLMPQTADLTADEVVRSEVNFLVLPFFALWDKDVKKRTKTEFKAVFKRGNQKLEVCWTVFALPEFGYPGPFGKKVHKAIEQIISELPRPIQTPIPLGSFRNLYQRMGFKTFGGWQYDRIKEALKRIIATTVESKGSFYSKKKEKWMEDVFHLYERLISKGDILDNGEIADTNYLYLNSWYLENINANYVKPLDWDYYNFLETPLAQRFYELLGVKFFGVIMRKRKTLSYRYSTLCDLLPAARQKYLSDAKKSLDPAHKKLKETGFLADYDWDDTSPKTKGDWLITYLVGERAREEVRKAKNYFKSPQLEFETEALPEPKPERFGPEPEEEVELLTQEQTELLEGLVELNVTENVARDLVGHFDNELIQKWTEAVHYADAKDKAAYLVKAIREHWLLPERWLKSKEQENDKAKYEKIKQLEEERQKEEKRKRQEEAERLDSIYNSLADEQQQEVSEEAEKRFSFIVREWIRDGKTDSPIVQAERKSKREEVLKEWMESGQI
jgi:hypothetical protein